MAVTNRAAKLAKLHRVAKKHYQPVSPPNDRTVLEHLLYACVLEDSTFDDADQAFARLQEGYFDWNEVRVTTAVELSEVLGCLTDSNEAAVRLKKTLHAMFETHYTFDIDSLRKENLGKAIEKMESYNGATPFVVSYVAQNGLGGHSIGVDRSLINLMYTIGVIDEKEASKGIVPGIERAISKNKGVEFFSLVHQMAVAYSTSPFNNDIRAVLLSVDAGSKDRFPKRTRKKKPVPVPVEPPVEQEPVKETKAAPKGKSAKGKSAKAKAASKPETKKKAAGKKVADKKPAAKSKSASKAKATKSASKKKVAKKTTKKKTTKKAATKKTAKKKAASKPAKKKKATKKAAKKKPTKSNSKRLAKKKPR